MFPCNINMRNWSNPGHSTEPDLVHDILGQVPLLFHKVCVNAPMNEKGLIKFQQTANIIARIGEISIGATDEEIDELVKLYLHTGPDF